MLNLQSEKNKHYALARKIAQEKRAEFAITTKQINLNVLKKIYKKEKIRIDPREKIGSKIRAAYFSDTDGCSVLVSKDLPRGPKIFSLAHELKHHFIDKELIENGKVKCGAYNENETIEVAAEIFAAEFLFPEQEMRDLVLQMGINANSCTPERIVELKRSCPNYISYIFIKKRLVYFGIIQKKQFSDIQFKKLEEKLYPPIHIQPWFKKYRERKKSQF